MNQSVALRDTLLRLYETESSGAVSALESLVSHRNDALAIGSDPEE